ncbi:MAG TPA: SDR family oxidoreductase [Devosiaceae bacterium]
MNLFVFGLGFSASAAVAALREQHGADLAVSGTTRDEQRRSALRDQGIAAHLFEGRHVGEELAADLAAATHVIVSVPPGTEGDPVLALGQKGLDTATNLEWICYYSTVGVYGDCGGAWVDETAPCKPVHPRSQVRVKAEQAWRAYARRRQVPLAVLRLAGIYGPGRSTFDKLRAGKARRIIKPGQVFNRIHVADIGRVTALAAESRIDGTFNLADDEPAPPQDLVTFAAGLLGMAPPPKVPFEQADLSEMGRSFYSSNERISNAAIKKALGIELLFPSYREGLGAIFYGERE